MKKIALALTAIAAMLTTACTNDAIEIEYDEQHTYTLNVNTENLYDQFDIKSSVMTQALSSENNYQVAIISLAYDAQGVLTDSAATYLKTFRQVQQQLNVSRGGATIVTIETLVDPANDYEADGWAITGADELSTLNIKAKRTNAYWYEAIGLSTQRVNVSGSQTLNVTPEPLGSIVTTKFYNLDKTDNDYAALYTQNGINGYRVDPSLPQSDHYIIDAYNPNRTWDSRGSEQNRGGHLDETCGFDAYIIESGSIRWCISSTKIGSDNTIKFTAYPNNQSYFNFENGKRYYAGLFYNGSTYQAFIGSQSEYQTWYNQVRGTTPTPTTLYREPYTTWGASVATVKSYMSSYRLRSDIEYDNELQGYYINFFGADKEDFVEYYFRTATTDLTDAYVYIDTATDLATVQAHLLSHGYKLNRYDSEEEYYIYTNADNTTAILLYTSTAYHVINYYNPSAYTSSVKAKAPRRQSPLRRP
jgi:hypothetical protein